MVAGAPKERGRKTARSIPGANSPKHQPQIINYLQWTEWNVRVADATVIFTLDSKLEAGSRRTADFAAELGKPWIHIRSGVRPRYLARLLPAHTVKTLSIAGKREHRSDANLQRVSHFQ